MIIQVPCPWTSGRGPGGRGQGEAWVLTTRCPPLPPPLHLWCRDSEFTPPMSLMKMKRGLRGCLPCQVGQGKGGGGESGSLIGGLQCLDYVCWASSSSNRLVSLARPHPLARDQQAEHWHPRCRGSLAVIWFIRWVNPTLPLCGDPSQIPESTEWAVSWGAH